MKPLSTALLLVLLAPAASASTWTTVDVGVTSNLNKVVFANARVGYICGSAGTILKTTNGGSTWTKLSPGVSADFSSIALADSAHLWVCGSGGTVLRSRDGGQTWSSLATGTTSTLRGMSLFLPSYLPADTILDVCGDAGVAIYTIDAGAHWYARVTGTSASLRAALNDYLYAAVVAGTGGTLLYATGTYFGPWPYPGSDDIVAMKGSIVSAPTTLYLLGSTGNVTRGVASWTWTTSSSGVSSARGLEVIGTKRWVVGAGGAIRYSADDGGTWTTQSFAGSGNFNAIAMLDTLTGYAVGDGGLVARRGGSTAGVGDGPAPTTPRASVLGPGAPSPFTSSTRLECVLPEARTIDVAVFGVDGRRVRTLAHETRPAGTSVVTWDGRDERGARAPAGVYFVRLQSDGLSSQRRIVRIE